MKQQILSITLLVLAFTLNAQTTQTITIDWGFNSTPDASGAANTDITIEVGDTVEWKWYDGGFHNVVSDGGTENFNSGSTTNKNGVNFSFPFNQVGSTNFICQPHSDIMFGTIKVVTDGTLSNPQFDFLTNLSIFPNPGNNEINISLQSLANDDLQLEAFDVLGKKIHAQQLSQLSSTINIAKWNAGMYLIKISKNDSQKSITKRFIKL